MDTQTRYLFNAVLDLFDTLNNPAHTEAHITNQIQAVRDLLDAIPTADETDAPKGKGGKKDSEDMDPKDLKKSGD